MDELIPFDIEDIELEDFSVFYCHVFNEDIGVVEIVDPFLR